MDINPPPPPNLLLHLLTLIGAPTNCGAVANFYNWAPLPCRLPASHHNPTTESRCCRGGAHRQSAVECSPPGRGGVRRGAASRSSVRGWRHVRWSPMHACLVLPCMHAWYSSGFLCCVCGDGVHVCMCAMTDYACGETVWGCCDCDCVHLLWLCGLCACDWTVNVWMYE